MDKKLEDLFAYLRLRLDGIQDRASDSSVYELASVVETLIDYLESQAKA